jgi:hypothetical protein
MNAPDKIARLHDALLLVYAIEDTPAGSNRAEFLQRIKRSYRQHGGLTEAMRESLVLASTR